MKTSPYDPNAPRSELMESIRLQVQATIPTGSAPEQLAMCVELLCIELEKLEARVAWLTARLGSSR